MRDDQARLHDILAAIDRILAKTSGGFPALERDEMLQVWVIHHLQIIGEAARCLSDDFTRTHPSEVWSQAAGMRHILVHHYFDSDLTRIWRVVEQDLLPLKRQLSEILALD